MMEPNLKPVRLEHKGVCVVQCPSSFSLSCVSLLLFLSRGKSFCLFPSLGGAASALGRKWQLTTQRIITTRVERLKVKEWDEARLGDKSSICLRLGTRIMSFFEHRQLLPSRFHMYTMYTCGRKSQISSNLFHCPFGAWDLAKIGCVFYKSGSPIAMNVTYRRSGLGKLTSAFYTNA